MLRRRLNWALMSGLSAVALIVAGLALSEKVVAGSCGASCKNEYNQCRISTKGSSSCEIAFTRCMQSCIRKK